MSSGKRDRTQHQRLTTANPAGGNAASSCSRMRTPSEPARASARGSSSTCGGGPSRCKALATAVITAVPLTPDVASIPGSYACVTATPPDSRLDLFVERSDARWREPCEHHGLRSSIALPVPRRDLVLGTATDARPHHLETCRLHRRVWFAGTDDTFTSVVQDSQSTGIAALRADAA